MGVYVFGEPGSLIVKVGKSHGSWTKQREDALRRSHYPDGRFLYFYDEITHLYCGWVEHRAHRYLKRRFHIQGEWFACGEAVARAVIRRCAKERKRHARTHGLNWKARA